MHYKFNILLLKRKRKLLKTVHTKQTKSNVLVPLFPLQQPQIQNNPIPLAAKAHRSGKKGFGSHRLMDSSA